MNRKDIYLNTLALVSLFFTVSVHSGNAQPAGNNLPTTLKSSGYAPVNGLKMYYEIHGEGKPLLLLHGSYMTIPLNWDAIMPGLAKKHKVIAVEIQGHGRTADINRPYSYTTLADDLAALLKYLKTDSAAILGYSLGATIGLEFATRHPSMVTNLVFISSAYKSEGWIKEARYLFPTIVPEFFENTPLKMDYDRLAPDKSYWKQFVQKLARFNATPYDLGIENVKKINCPVLIIKGDNDGVELSHTTEMYKLLGGGIFGDITGLPKSRLAILPGQTHVTLMMATDQLLELITPFLDKAN
jgi:pimeloyl-ACP methyl ester carboxylesterase